MHPKAILIQWSALPSDSLLNEILTVKTLLQKKIPEIEIITQGYQSLLLLWKKNIVHFEAEKDRISALYMKISSFKIPAIKHWKIPVCYHPEFAPDLKELSKNLDLNEKQLIDLHTKNSYRVQFIGFLPGFLYLSGLDEQLTFPRKSQPAAKVSAGAVGIGGGQTGIYPIESPGGWHIIGNTPIALFQPEAKSPCFAKSGDRISFESISVDEYNKIKQLVAKGKYRPKYD